MGVMVVVIVVGVVGVVVCIGMHPPCPYRHEDNSKVRLRITDVLYVPTGISIASLNPITMSAVGASQTYS